MDECEEGADLLPDNFQCLCNETQQRSVLPIRPESTFTSCLKALPCRAEYTENIGVLSRTARAIELA